MEYTVDYFIKKFEAIPEVLWIEGVFVDGEKRCANGHCGVRDYTKSTLESMSMQKVFSVLNPTYSRKSGLNHCTVSDIGAYSVKAAAVNNGTTNEYQQATPKERILAALYDIKKAQQPEVKIVYVTVDQPVRELQKKELSLQ